MKRTIPLAVLAFLFATSCLASYLVILRNGSKIVARDRYKIKGVNALITMENGTLVAIPLSQIDIPRTDKHNAANLGGASSLDWVDGDEPPPTPTPTPPLGRMITGLKSETVTRSPEEAQATPTPGIVFRGTKFREPRVDQVFQQGLENSHLYLYRTSQGTVPAYIFIEVRVNGEQEVMKTLEAICTTYSLVNKGLTDSGEAERVPERIELQLLNESGKEAGVFRISAAEAEELASGKVAPKKFFIDHVIY